MLYVFRGDETIARVAIDELRRRVREALPDGAEHLADTVGVAFAGEGVPF